MQNKISPCLWFDGNAKEATTFYCNHFADSRITAESPVVVEFEASGHNVICLNGGPQFRPNPSISFFYICTTADEIDALWKTFAEGGKVLMPLDKYPWSEKYGWVQDKYGVSWQLSLGKMADVGQKITPCLMFTGDQCGRAEEAIEHYSSVFPEAKLDGIMRYGPDQENENAEHIAHAQFALLGQKFMVMDSGLEHHFGFDEGISLTIYCADQEEIDYYWDKLTEGGEESMCGWLKDKFGVSWQVIPTLLGKLMSNPETAQQTAAAFMEMKKIEIDKLAEAQPAR